MRLGKLLKDAKRIIPAKGSGSLRAGWTTLGSGEPNIKRSATAALTAVPRLWPVMTIREGGMLKGGEVRKLSNVMPSVISPSSVGVPVDMPNPR